MATKDTTKTPKVVLFGYDSSPFTQKVRQTLRIKQIPYTFVIVPSMMPRPILQQNFNVTYRKIPVLVIDKDVYIDTSLIVEALEQQFLATYGFGTIYPDQAFRPLIRGFASFWTDRPFFRSTTGVIPVDVWRTSFGHDRANLIGHKLDAERLGRKIPENLSGLDLHLSILEPQVAGGHWIFHTSSPSAADTALYYQLEWAEKISRGEGVNDLTGGGASDGKGEGVSSVFNRDRYPNLSAWFRRYTQYLENLASTETRIEANDKPSIEALLGQLKSSELTRNIPLLSTPARPHTSLDTRNGLKLGSIVSIAPDDTGRGSPTVGKLLVITPEEVVITPESIDGRNPAVGEVRVHFPRLGFVAPTAKHLTEPHGANNGRCWPSGNSITFCLSISATTEDTQIAQIDASGDLKPGVRRESDNSENDLNVQALTISLPIRKHLEIELMHRWATSTYRSLVGIPDDVHLWQILAPKVALEFDFLMDGILALSALDIALDSATTDSSVYIQAALQYYENASGPYRWEICNLTRENHQAVFLFGLLAVAINLVIPHCVSVGVEQSSTLDHVLVAFDLLHGISAVTISCWDWLKDGPITFPLDDFRHNPLHLLDENTKTSISRLRAVNEAQLELKYGPGALSDIKPESCNRLLFKDCITNLEFLFAKEIEDEIKCICTAFPGLCGKPFTTAVSNSEPMALYILMHWGVLLARLGDEAWWARPAGKNLVAELSESLTLLQADQVPQWQEGILWARKEAGLKEML